MLKNNTEFYHEVDRLINYLAAEGFSGLSEKLKDAKGVSGIASEIFGEIGLVLNTIESETSFSTPIKHSKDTLLNYIRRCL
jgi:hypothetical protein